jgi:KUP system potassium uptake protein
MSHVEGDRRDVGGGPSRRSVGVLALTALGVVFGDIGTSPLYALQTVFSIDHGAVKPTSADVYGVISLVFWSILLIVSLKYVVFILRADNDGEGGVMALAALARDSVRGSGRLAAATLLLGVLGASLFFGDSLITPAISVLSAVEGVKVASPGVGEIALPLGVAVLTVLFVVQRFGTHHVGRFFGPVMALWFAALAAVGLPKIAADPGVLRGLSPSYLVTFVAAHPYVTFIALGAVVLVITGAEALYADMGHFGRPPIRRAWFFAVFPALTANYLGQAALILDNPRAAANPFFTLVPGWARIPMVVLATLATVIASQAVISGAYSVTRQAMRLGYLPYLTVRQTSAREGGQIYLPAVNWLLFAGVLILMVGFRSSAKLATAYGLAVTGTLLLTTALFLVVARARWHWPLWRLAAVTVVFGGIEGMFFAANLTKVEHGGWLPLVIGALVITVMTTWQRGRQIITRRRIDLEGPLSEFVEQLHTHPVPRVPGTAVFPHPTKQTVPLALRANVAFNQVLHEHVVIISVTAENVPHIPRSQRLSVDSLGYADDGIVHLASRFGFQDAQDIPSTLRDAFMLTPELEVDTETASYFLSHLTLEQGSRGAMMSWRKRLFIALAHNAATPAAYFRLPIERTVVMGSRLQI